MWFTPKHRLYVGIKPYILCLTILTKWPKNRWDIIEISIISPALTTNGQTNGEIVLVFCIGIYVIQGTTYEASENDEILIIATGFNTNELNYVSNLHVTIHRHNMKYANDDISTIATAFMTNEPKYGVNIEIYTL